MYIYIYIYMCIYIYIYMYVCIRDIHHIYIIFVFVMCDTIYEWLVTHTLCTHCDIYVYIRDKTHVYMYMYIYVTRLIYIYIYTYVCICDIYDTYFIYVLVMCNTLHESSVTHTLWTHCDIYVLMCDMTHIYI